MITPVTHNLGWLSIIPRCVRLCVFKFGVLPFATIYERIVLNRWHNHFAGSGYCSQMNNYDISRAERITDFLSELGGIDIRLEPQDKEAKVQMVLLSSKALRGKIESFGARWEHQGSEMVIIEPTTSLEKWRQFREGYLTRMFPDSREDGAIITGHNVGETRRIDCMLFACLGRSFAMNKSGIASYLGKGIDVCVYDSRGVLNSKGYPTEGGLYNDIEAVGENLFNAGYTPNKVCLYGTCGESFTAIHLFKQYHAKGINLLLENAPNSLDSVISRLDALAQWLFTQCKSYIRAPINSECRHAPEDGFNSLTKINSLTKSPSAGRVLLATTKGDELAPPEEVLSMRIVLEAKGNETSMLIHTPPNDLDDPHLASPLKDPALQEGLQAFLFES